MNPELVRAYLAKACGCMDPNGQWQKRYGAKMKMCGNCAHLFNLFTRDDLTEAFQHVRRLKSLDFLVSSYLAQAPSVEIGNALGEFYRHGKSPSPKENVLNSSVEGR